MASPTDPAPAIDTTTTATTSARRSRSPSNEPATPPPGWTETPGYAPQHAPSARCELCAAGPTAANPLKLCEGCLVELCWACERRRGTLDHSCQGVALTLPILRDRRSAPRGRRVSKRVRFDAAEPATTPRSWHRLPPVCHHEAPLDLTSTLLMPLARATFNGGVREGSPQEERWHWVRDRRRLREEKEKSLERERAEEIAARLVRRPQRARVLARALVAEFGDCFPRLEEALERRAGRAVACA